MKMNPTLLALACAFVTPIALFASPPADALLLKADRIVGDRDRLTLIGNATVAMRGGETRLTAAEIIYDQPAGVLRFNGPVTIHTRDGVIEAKDATLHTQGKRVFTLTAGEVSLKGTQAPELSSGSKFVPAFSESLPKTETKLPTGPR